MRAVRSGVSQKIKNGTRTDGRPRSLKPAAIWDIPSWHKKFLRELSKRNSANSGYRRIGGRKSGGSVLSVFVDLCDVHDLCSVESCKLSGIRSIDHISSDDTCAMKYWYRLPNPWTRYDLYFNEVHTIYRYSAEVKLKLFILFAQIFLGIDSDESDELHCREWI